MSARIPAGTRVAVRVWIIGNTKASVLPVPVCAVATRFFPANAGSMDAAWMAVGVSKPFRARLVLRSGERGSSENVVISCKLSGRKSANRLPVREKASRSNFLLSYMIAGPIVRRYQCFPNGATCEGQRLSGPDRPGRAKATANRQREAWDADGLPFAIRFCGLPRMYAHRRTPACLP